MANITVTTHATWIPEVWAGDIMAATRRNLVLANLVRRFDTDVKNGGDVIHIPRLANLAAADKAAGTAVTFQANTEGEYLININKHKVVPFLVEDITKAQARQDLRSAYTDDAGYLLARAVDSDIAGLYTGLSQTVAGGAALDDADIITAIEFLDVADAPRDGRVFVIHPEAMSDLRAVNKFVTYDNTGKTGIQEGRNNGLVANVYGVDVYMTNQIVESAGTPNILHNLLFHKDAFGLAMQVAPKVESEYSVDYLGTKVAAHSIYGVAELRDNHAVDVQLNS